MGVAAAFSSRALHYQDRKPPATSYRGGIRATPAGSPSGDSPLSCLEDAGVLLDFCFSNDGEAELFERVYL